MSGTGALLSPQDWVALDLVGRPARSHEPGSYFRGVVQYCTWDGEILTLGLKDVEKRRVHRFWEPHPNYSYSGRASITSCRASAIEASLAIFYVGAVRISLGGARAGRDGLVHGRRGVSIGIGDTLPLDDIETLRLPGRYFVAREGDVSLRGKVASVMFREEYVGVALTGVERRQSRDGPWTPDIDYTFGGRHEFASLTGFIDGVEFSVRYVGTMRITKKKSWAQKRR